MRLLNLKIPEPPKQTDTIHPEHSDDEYIGNFFDYLLGENTFFNDTYNKFSEQYSGRINEAEKVFKSLSVPGLESKIEMIKSAIQYVDNSIQLQKMAREDSTKIDDVLQNTCFHKKVLNNELNIAEEILTKKQQAV